MKRKIITIAREALILLALCSVVAALLSNGDLTIWELLETIGASWIVIMAVYFSLEWGR